MRGGTRRWAVVENTLMAQHSILTLGQASSHGQQHLGPACQPLHLHWKIHKLETRSRLTPRTPRFQIPRAQQIALGISMSNVERRTNTAVTEPQSMFNIMGPSLPLYPHSIPLNSAHIADIVDSNSARIQGRAENLDGYIGRRKTSLLPSCKPGQCHDPHP